jgi:hypothetical protein
MKQVVEPDASLVDELLQTRSLQAIGEQPMYPRLKSRAQPDPSCASQPGEIKGDREAVQLGQSLGSTSPGSAPNGASARGPVMNSQ